MYCNLGINESLWIKPLNQHHQTCFLPNVLILWVTTAYLYQWCPRLSSPEWSDNSLWPRGWPNGAGGQTRPPRVGKGAWGSEGGGAEPGATNKSHSSSLGMVSPIKINFCACAHTKPGLLLNFYLQSVLFLFVVIQAHSLIWTPPCANPSPKSNATPIPLSICYTCYEHCHNGQSNTFSLV